MVSAKNVVKEGKYDSVPYPQVSFHFFSKTPWVVQYSPEWSPDSCARQRIILYVLPALLPTVSGNGPARKPRFLTHKEAEEPNQGDGQIERY